jgi:hypothetical protein
MGAAYLERAKEFEGMTDWAELLERYPEVTDILPHLDMPVAKGAARILDLHRRHAAEVKRAALKMLERAVSGMWNQHLDDDCLLRTMYESRGLASPQAVVTVKGDGQEKGKANGKFSFREAGDHYEVVFEGRPRFTVPNTLGSKYVDYLLHNPNQPVRVLELEALIRADKKDVRAAGSTQSHQDGQTKKEVQRELLELQKELQEAEEADNPGAVGRIQQEIRALKSADKAQAGITADAGERARNNVRKAVGAVIRRLRRGNAHQKAFAAHLGQHLKLGYEVIYSRDGGDEWE